MKEGTHIQYIIESGVACISGCGHASLRTSTTNANLVRCFFGCKYYMVIVFKIIMYYIRFSAQDFNLL